MLDDLIVAVIILLRAVFFSLSIPAILVLNFLWFGLRLRSFEEWCAVKKAKHPRIPLEHSWGDLSSSCISPLLLGSLTRTAQASAYLVECLAQVHSGVLQLEPFSDDCLVCKWETQISKQNVNNRERSILPSKVSSIRTAISSQATVRSLIIQVERPFCQSTSCESSSLISFTISSSVISQAILKEEMVSKRGNNRERTKRQTAPEREKVT